MHTPEWDVAVIGAGVLGSFHAYFACRRGLRVLLIERDGEPRGASTRNFGMIVAGAMAPGEWHRFGIDSAAIYGELAATLGLPISRSGTLYLAGTPEEAAVLEEFARIGPAQGYTCRLLDRAQSSALNPLVRPESCLAGLHFPNDLRLEPRSLFRTLIPWLAGQPNLTFLPRTVAVAVYSEDHACRIITADGQSRHARHVIVCNGADLRTLFPERYAAAGLVQCKLQMMKLDLGDRTPVATSLASGLSLRRYPSFRICSSWTRLDQAPMDPELAMRGIHILLVQDADGSIVLGDSHEYSPHELDERLDARTEELILQEAERIFRLPSWRVRERWHGIYCLHPDKECHTETIGERIHLVTGIGGKGMTTGPAVAAANIARIWRV